MNVATDQKSVYQYRDFLINFLNESNAIERVPPPPADVVHKVMEFIMEPIELSKLTSIVQEVQGPEEVSVGVLRAGNDMQVVVGGHIPPPGGKKLIEKTNNLVYAVKYNNLHHVDAHHRFQWLHPYLDGNGRAGRLLWAWHTYHHDRGAFNNAMFRGFSVAWYYSSLQFLDKRMDDIA